jgi:hypothetical protein
MTAGWTLIAKKNTPHGDGVFFVCPFASERFHQKARLISVIVSKSPDFIYCAAPVSAGRRALFLLVCR